jgi:exodeoxyribonuclease VII large subunit
MVDGMEPAGLGELQLLFEALKERLRKEGLFAPERKRPLPFLPRRIGLITSPSGAAIQDILRVLYVRHPKAWVRVVPVRVQGDGAAEVISQAIEILQRGGGQVDVLVLARGGGSLEDLWAFNDERVARALAASSIPTISAVGHEVDFSIADFVADVRAQTPTQAAELLVPDLRDLLERVGAARKRMRMAFEALQRGKRAELLRLLKARPIREPDTLTQALFERCDLRGKELRNHLYNRKRQWEDAAGSIFGRLESLNPLRVLARGYSVTTDGEGRVVRDIESVTIGENLRIRLFQGALGAKVVDIQKNEPSGV